MASVAKNLVVHKICQGTAVEVPRHPWTPACQQRPKINKPRAVGWPISFLKVKHLWVSALQHSLAISALVEGDVSGEERLFPVGSCVRVSQRTAYPSAGMGKKRGWQSTTGCVSSTSASYADGRMHFVSSVEALAGLLFCFIFLSLGHDVIINIVCTWMRKYPQLTSNKVFIQWRHSI